jgi:hypothetical protein
MQPRPNPHLYHLDRPLTRDEVLAELAALPERLREALEGASEARLVDPPRPGDWSAFQVLCHVRDATFTYAARFRWIVFNDDPFMPDYDENNWVAACRDTPADVPEILEQVVCSRRDLVRVLSRMPEAAWRRTGRHEVAGSIVLEDYARHQVAHEAMHLGQIRAALVTATTPSDT